MNKVKTGEIIKNARLIKGYTQQTGVMNTELLRKASYTSQINGRKMVLQNYMAFVS